MLARPYIGDARSVAPVENGETLSRAQSVRLMKTYATELGARVRQVCSQMPAYNWAILVGAAVAGLAGGFSFWRITSALSCATFGTMLIFAGMILLLLYKGSGPISSILQKSPFYAIVFGAMAAFGTVEQLIVCRQKNIEPAKGKESDKGAGELSSAKQSWRNA